MTEFALSGNSDCRQGGIITVVDQHSDVKTTEIYTYVMEKDISKALSQIDSLWEP